MEGEQAIIPLPCKYRAEGCFETVLFNSKFGHEERCSFRIIYQCPIDPVCGQINGYKNMCIHLKNHHTNVFNFVDFVEERESFCIGVFKESENIVHAFHIKQWGLFFLQKVCVGDLTGLFMQVIRAATNQLDFNYSLEVCDHNETRKEYFKGCVLPMEKPTEEIMNTGKYLLLSDLILKTINTESPIMIVVRIWKNV
ncbi:hypothetical protein R5R35_001076 [Gryllus longicercus]|uniref:SIAH-type domain-containing protein n=2 Tax=Gryllus longicercus TaxID=2509291 RepID=A0AAN9VTM9_9ORTH